MTMGNLTTNSAAPLAFDYTKEAPSTVELPLGWLDHELEWTRSGQNDTKALMLTAAVFTNPEVTDGSAYLNSEHTLAVRLLALYAAGARVRLHRNDLSDLIALARKLAAKVGGELGDNIEYVCKRAAERDASDGFVELEVLDGRGYCDLGAGIPDEFSTATPRERLLTYAALFAPAKPRLCNRHADALVVLALYGAGANFSLTRAQYNRLQKRVGDYLSRMNAERFAGFSNARMAKYIRRHAFNRAQRAGLFGSSK